MSKFKVGDMVEVVKSGHQSTVRHVALHVDCQGGPLVVLDDPCVGGYNAFDPNQLTLIGRPGRSIELGLGDLVAKPTKPDTLSTRLARCFGLAPDACEDTLFDTASKAWHGFEADRAVHQKAIQSAHADRDNARRVCEEWGDTMGDLNSANGLLEEENREVLAENARLRRRLGE